MRQRPQGNTKPCQCFLVGFPWMALALLPLSCGQPSLTDELRSLVATQAHNVIREKKISYPDQLLHSFT